MKNLSRRSTLFGVPPMGFYINAIFCMWLVLTSGSAFPLLGFTLIHLGMMLLTRKVSS